MTDFIFGSPPEQTTTPTTTLTPEQEELLRTLIEQITGGLDGGTFGLEASDLELQSLAGLEALGTSIPGGEAGTEATNAGLEALQGIFTQGPQNIDDFFAETIRGPAIENFNRDIIPGIRGRLAGQFFGGERREAEGRATEDLIDSLTRERTRVGFEARNTDQLNILKGLQTLPGAVGSQFTAATAQGNILLGLLGAGGTERDIVQQQLNERNRRVQEALGSLGVQGFENIVFNDPGSTGLLTTILGSLAGNQSIGQLGAPTGGTEEKKKKEALF